MMSTQDTLLALTWRPLDHDLERFQQLYPMLMELYAGVSIATPPGDTENLERFATQHENMKLHISPQGQENRRYQTLRQALEFHEAQYIHACDGDHAVSRIASHLEDWRESLVAMRDVDCLIIGRSPQVFESYPPALKETERLINLTASYHLDKEIDLGSGARGFSRRAATYLIQHSSPETHALATDSEWPVLLHRAGFSVGTYESKGAYYAIYSEEHRERLHSAAQWHKRVNIAHLIIQAGIDAAKHSN